MIPSHSYPFSRIVVTLYFFLFFLFSFILHALASPKLQYCRHDQRDALLEFKHEFPMNLTGRLGEYDMRSWNKRSDCCSWKGVECDVEGQVISLFFYNVPFNNSLKPNSSLFKLQYLENLTILKCNLYGEIPSSLGNLSHLTKLDLSYNELVGQVPASIGNLTQLRALSLYKNNLSGKISSSFANLTKLFALSLAYNCFEPELLPDMSRFHNLEVFDVSENSFFEPFPTSLFTITSLDEVELGGNHFKGPIDFGNFSLSSRLQFLFLYDNKFDGPIPESIFKFSNLEMLDLHNNSFIGPIPTSISQLVTLSYLDVSNNELQGTVPSCLWSLTVMKLSHNSFSSFGKPSEVLDQAQMRVLSLDSNSFHGPFPHWICKLSSLQLLDLSNNSFSGSIPSCLRNITNFLQVLIMRNNNFSGTLPDVFVNATNLNALDVSRNRLEGKFPKSLINCSAMEFLNVESNNFKDKFPYWLGSLSSLNVLILRSNLLYGPLYHRHVSIGFQNLKVIDVSHNDLSGTLPAFYFSSWIKMKTTLDTEYVGTYMEEYISMSDSYIEGVTSLYRNSMAMVHKGVATEFERIRTDFRAIDLSENRFCGKIPESVGLLKGLLLLNLSSNAFKGDISQSLANLTALEELDLSCNQLSGQIPRDLGILSFLSIMDFSHNNLEGSIPRSTQFQSQNCSSFMYNPRLYGLEEICGKSHVLNLPPQESEDLSEPEEQVINWIAAAIAYGPGVFCGLVIGHIFVTHKQEWFTKNFSRNKPRVAKIYRVVQKATSL